MSVIVLLMLYIHSKLDIVIAVCYVVLLAFQESLLTKREIIQICKV